MANATFVRGVKAVGTSGSSITHTAFNTVGCDYLTFTVTSYYNVSSVGTITITVAGSATGISLKDSALSPNNSAGVWVYEMKAPAAGTPDIVLGWNGGEDADRMTFEVEGYVNVDQTTPSGTAVHTQGEVSGTPSVNVTTVSGDLATLKVFSASFTTTITPAGSQTSRLAQAAISGNANTSDLTASGTTTAMGATVEAGTDYAMVGFAIKTAASSGVTVTPTGFAMTMSLGTFTTQNDITLIGVPSFPMTMVLGTPSVTIGTSTNVTLNPVGFSLTMSLGNPATLRSGVLILAPSLPMTMVLGTPTVRTAVPGSYRKPNGMQLGLHIGIR